MIRVLPVIRLRAGFADRACRSATQPAVGAKSWPGHVDEYGAAAAGDARPGVVVDFDDQIVEVVGAAEPVAWFIGRAPERSVVAPVGGSSHQASFGPMRRTGSQRRGRGRRSARHHSRSGRNRPRGVPPSPSRLSARTPARPSATGMANGPANSQPCDLRPGRALTRSDRMRSVQWIRFRASSVRPPDPTEFLKCRLLLYPGECSTSRHKARQNRAGRRAGHFGARRCRIRARF